MQFAAIFNAISGSKIFCSVDEIILAACGSPSAAATLDQALQVIAVHTGLREAALMVLRGELPPGLQVGVVRVFPRSSTFFVYNTVMRSGVDAWAAKLVARYRATRHELDNRTERAMGSALGYLQPNIRCKQAIDGGLAFHIVLSEPDGRILKRIQSEYGPQSIISSERNLFPKVRRIRAAWDGLAKKCMGSRVGFEATLNIWSTDLSGKDDC
jgi:hypothetical protein